LRDGCPRRTDRVADPGTDVPHAATFPPTCPDGTVMVTAKIAGRTLTATGFRTGAHPQ